MTDKEYNKAKEECWKAVKKELDLHYWGGPTLDIVSHTFDRAYALGKQTEKVTQEEIESKAVGYAMDVNNDRLSTYPEAMRPQLYPEYDMDDLANAFEAGANFALGKQEKDAEDTVIQGWVCRDKKDNALYLHVEKPYRAQSGCDVWDDPDWWESDCPYLLPLDKSLFPNLTCDSDPIEVELIIKRKKK